jgi:hypothetical protein
MVVHYRTLHHFVSPDNSKTHVHSGAIKLDMSDLCTFNRFGRVVADGSSRVNCSQEMRLEDPESGEGLIFAGCFSLVFYYALLYRDQLTRGWFSIREFRRI